LNNIEFNFELLIMIEAILADLLFSENRYKLLTFKQLVLLKQVCKYFKIIIDKLSLIHVFKTKYLENRYFIENGRRIKHGCELYEYNDIEYFIPWNNGIVNGIFHKYYKNRLIYKLNYKAGVLNGKQIFQYKNNFCLIYSNGKAIEHPENTINNKPYSINKKSYYDYIVEKKSEDCYYYIMKAYTVKFSYGTVIPFFCNTELYLDRGLDVNRFPILIKNDEKVYKSNIYIRDWEGELYEHFELVY
jgi:hypothetical protein